MSTTATIAAGIAVAGALIAAAFLPARAARRVGVRGGELPEPAAA